MQFKFEETPRPDKCDGCGGLERYLSFVTVPHIGLWWLCSSCKTLFWNGKRIPLIEIPGVRR